MLYRCPHKWTDVLILLVSFNQTLMLLGTLIIVNSHKQKITTVAQNWGRIFFVLDLLHSCSHVLIPLEFYNQCRIVTFVLRFRYKHKVCKPSTCRKLTNRFEIVLHRTQICDCEYTAKWIFIVILNRRSILVMDFFNLNRNRHPIHVEWGIQ